MAALCDENVRGLDVAMDNPRGMRGIQSIGDFNAERQEYFDFEGAAGDALLRVAPSRHSMMMKDRPSSSPIS